jgi:hypothetical protein
VDPTEGSIEWKTTAGSQCAKLRRSSPWPRRLYRPDDDVETAEQQWERRCGLSEREGRGERMRGRGKLRGAQGVHLVRGCGGGDGSDEGA